jgi:hypothetical protein
MIGDDYHDMSPGKVYRGTPLPGGYRYWQNFTTRAMAESVQAWLSTQKAMGNVSFINYAGDPIAKGDVFFALFEVPLGKHMAWPELEYGAPTIAPHDASKRSDVDPDPPPEPTFDTSVFSQFALAGATPLLLGLAALLLLSSVGKGD